MKTKKKTYILLVLVLAVWGTIAYQIITGLNPELPELETSKVIAVKNFKLDTKIDTFSISTVDRDPFLGTVQKKKSKTTVKTKRKPFEWLPVEYLGIINNSNHRSRVYILNINGKQYLLKKGQAKDSVTLVYGNKHKVTLRYKGRQKAISRKQD